MSFASFIIHIQISKLNVLASYSFMQVHGYIQYMNAWRNVIWDEEQATKGKPTSYLIALLIIKAYEISADKSKERFDVANVAMFWI